MIETNLVASTRDENNDADPLEISRRKHIEAAVSDLEQQMHQLAVQTVLNSAPLPQEKSPNEVTTPENTPSSSTALYRDHFQLQPEYLTQEKLIRELSALPSEQLNRLLTTLLIPLSANEMARPYVRALLGMKDTGQDTSEEPVVVRQPEFAVQWKTIDPPDTVATQPLFGVLQVVCLTQSGSFDNPTSSYLGHDSLQSLGYTLRILIDDGNIATIQSIIPTFALPPEVDHVVIPLMITPANSDPETEAEEVAHQFDFNAVNRELSIGEDDGIDLETSNKELQLLILKYVSELISSLSVKHALGTTSLESMSLHEGTEAVLSYTDQILDVDTIDIINLTNSQLLSIIPLYLQKKYNPDQSDYVITETQLAEMLFLTIRTLLDEKITGLSPGILALKLMKTSQLADIPRILKELLPHLYT